MCLGLCAPIFFFLFFLWGKDCLFFLFLIASNRFQNQVITNQLKRQAEETNHLRESLENKSANESKLERQVREAQRKYADLESRMKEDLMMARIREAENTQCVAELTQKISSLEYKVVFQASFYTI